MTAADEPVAAIAVEHAAKLVERRHHKVFIASAAVTVGCASAMAAIGLAGIPLGIIAFAIAGRSLGKRRRAAEVARATRDAARSWSLVGATAVGRAPDRRDLELALTPGAVRSLRALPPARVVLAGAQTASSTPPEIDR